MEMQRKGQVSRMSRLIDADALLELYADRLEKLEERYGVHSSECGVLAGAMKLLEIQPTIEPEQKTGRWYKQKGMMPPEYMGVYRCSECDEMAMRDWKHHRQELTNYCPNCGADMREGGAG